MEKMQNFKKNEIKIM